MRRKKKGEREREKEEKEEMEEGGRHGVLVSARIEHITRSDHGINAATVLRECSRQYKVTHIEQLRMKRESMTGKGRG